MTAIAIPRNGSKVGRIDDFDLYQLQEGWGSVLWINFKLLNPNDSPKWGARRVYRIAWNVIEQRCPRGGENWYLQKERPELARQVIAFLQSEYPPGYATDPDGLALTPAQLQAETDIMYASQDKRKMRTARRNKSPVTSPVAAPGKSTDHWTLEDWRDYVDADPRYDEVHWETWTIEQFREEYASRQKSLDDLL